MENDLQKCIQLGYISRGDVIKYTKITPITFSEWCKGSKICPPMPHVKIQPPGWKSYRIFINPDELDEWLSLYKPWVYNSDYKNWRSYPIQGV